MNGVERSNDGVVLRKCPFCGGEARLTNNAVKKGETWLWAVECDKCEFYMADEYEFHVVNRWNTRTPVDKVLERLEKEIAENSEASLCGYRAGLYDAIEIIKEEVG